jgi:hypothetical protein
MICINPNTKEFKDILAQVGDPLAAEIEYNKQYGTSAIKSGVQELFDSNSELASVGTLQQYSQYLDTIFPDSQVKNIVYRGSEKGIEKDEKFWLYFSDSPNDAYLYGKAHISKGGNITERNPIDAINIAAQKYFKNKYNNNNLLNSLKEEKIKGVIEKSSKITRKLKDIPIKELERRSEFTPLDFDEEDPSKEIIRNYLKTGNNSNYEITTNKYDKSEFNNVSEIAKKYNVEERDVELVFSIQEVENRYKYVKIESEADLMKPYDDTWYQENIEDYTKARKYIDDVLGIDNVRENIGKLESVILNITNPLDGGNQEDLLNNREAYQNGHDGAILSGGEHFIIKNKPEQIHILGNKQDIERFKKFIGSKPAQNPNLSSFDNQRISTINSLNDMIKNFRVDEILAEKGYDVRDIISNLETASNQTELNKIINKLLYLLC